MVSCDYEDIKTWRYPENKYVMTTPSYLQISYTSCVYLQSSLLMEETKIASVCQ